MTGSGTLAINMPGSSLTATTINVGGSNKLMLVGTGGAWAAQPAAAFNIANGGTLQLATTGTTAIAFDLPAQNVSPVNGQNASFNAGMDFSGQAGAANGGTVSLTNGLTNNPGVFNIAGGKTMSFSANSSYTLNVNSPVTNSGTLAGGATPALCQPYAEQRHGGGGGPGRRRLEPPQPAECGPVRAMGTRWQPAA